jgi:hypothetical protein
MTYFIVFGAILAVIGLAAISVAEEAGLMLFLVKRHFDHQDGTARP